MRTPLLEHSIGRHWLPLASQVGELYSLVTMATMTSHALPRWSSRQIPLMDSISDKLNVEYNVFGGGISNKYITATLIKCIMLELVKQHFNVEKIWGKPTS